MPARLRVSRAGGYLVAGSSDINKRKSATNYAPAASTANNNNKANWTHSAAVDHDYLRMLPQIMSMADFNLEDTLANAVANPHSV